MYPVGGVENAFTYMCNEWGQYNTFVSDKFGLNNANKIYEEETATLLIGDSFSFGACVQDIDSLSSNMERLLSEKIF